MRYRAGLSRGALILSTLLVALFAPATASAAPRMWVGFQDDPSFRWVDDRVDLLERAREANATVIRTTVYWSRTAPRRPASAADPFDPAYLFSDLDELVRGAQSRGLEVMLTIWGTPKWAGPAENRLPRRLADFQSFARALAARYSGRYAGYPHVRFFSIWNEANRGLFLSPQFDSRGRSTAPQLYAKLVRAGYAGIKAGNPLAQVAIGETASNGRDRKTARADRQDTHSPGRFAQLLSELKPRVKFDAWAHHPYPTSPSMKPTQRMRWPNVSLASLPTFETSLDTWFKRKDVPVWITEYGHETKPDKRGISPALQRTYLSQALAIARKDARVQMFVWFILGDRPEVPWESGLLAATGTKKAAFATFAALARAVDARNAIVEVRRANTIISFSALEMASRTPVGSLVGIAWEVRLGSASVTHDIAASSLARDGWVRFPLRFTPTPGRTYTLRLEANAASGAIVQRTLTLVAPPRRRLALSASTTQIPVEGGEAANESKSVAPLARDDAPVTRQPKRGERLAADVTGDTTLAAAGELVARAEGGESLWLFVLLGGTALAVGALALVRLWRVWRNVARYRGAMLVSRQGRRERSG